MDPSPRPPERLDVDLQPVARGGRTRTTVGPVVAVVAVLLVLGGSVWLSQAFPADERPERPPPVAVAPTSAFATVSPAPDAPTDAAPTGAVPAVAARIDRQSLVTRV